jgi:hypothetical protein
MDETLPDMTPATGGAGGSKPVPREVEEALPSARFGKFVRTEKLGAGGMGEVWKAWDTELNRWVALKFLKGGDDEEIARFKREAQTAGALSHPNIAAIHEVGQAHERHYIAMQYIAGQTLKSFPRSDVRTVVGLVRDAAGALQYAHEQGVIHRDVKPENLMVVSRAGSHHLYVMDFGLARTVEGEKSVSGSVVGTPVYMAPEQGRGGGEPEGGHLFAGGDAVRAADGPEAVQRVERVGDPGEGAGGGAEGAGEGEARGGRGSRDDRDEVPGEGEGEEVRERGGAGGGPGEVAGGGGGGGEGRRRVGADVAASAEAAARVERGRGGRGVPGGGRSDRVEVVERRGEPAHQGAARGAHTWMSTSLSGVRVKLRYKKNLIFIIACAPAT